MEKANPNFPKLTENDKYVLKKIISHSKIPDSSIAQDIGISPQAVFKIRSKLESLGIIKGYTPIIDYAKIGIRTMSVIIIRVKEEIWDDCTDDWIAQRIIEIPYLISAYRTVDSRATHIFIMGFRDMKQKERCLTQLQTKNQHEIEIREVYTFSADHIIIQNSMAILNEILDKQEYTRFDLFNKDK